jgi:hypothetical protein
MKHDFELWLEFEHWTDRFDVTDEYFNMQIILPSGSKYVLNVWTVQCALNQLRELEQDTSTSHLMPPDLIVRKAERTHIEEVVANLIMDDRLKSEWLSTNSSDQ